MYGTVDHNQFGRGRYCFLLAVNSEDTFTDGTSKGQFLSFLAFAFSHPKTLSIMYMLMLTSLYRILHVNL